MKVRRPRPLSDLVSWLRAERATCRFCGQTYLIPHGPRVRNHKCAAESADRVSRMERAGADGDALAAEFERELEEAKRRREGRP